MYVAVIQPIIAQKLQKQTLKEGISVLNQLIGFQLLPFFQPKIRFVLALRGAGDFLNYEVIAVQGSMDFFDSW